MMVELDAGVQRGGGGGVQNSVSVFLYNKVVTCHQHHHDNHHEPHPYKVLLLEKILLQGHHHHIHDYNDCHQSKKLVCRYRYTEKSPGRIVGDSQCEKLPVEVTCE